MKFLILSTGPVSKFLTDAITSAGHTFEAHDPRDMYLYISEIDRGYDRVYIGDPSLDEPKRIMSNHYDAIISRIGKDLPLAVNILRHLTMNLGIYCPQSSLGIQIAHDKLFTSQILSCEGVKTPMTVFSCRPNHVSFFVDKLGGLPIVVKQLTGSQGTGVSILETPLSTNTTLESLHRAGVPVKMQRFIKSEGMEVEDFRAIVVGGKVVSAMRRTAPQGDFRANLSRGGTGSSVKLFDYEIQMAIDAAKALMLEFAGVDIMRSNYKKKESYITEVNGNPGTGIINITKHNHFKDLVEFTALKAAAKKKEKPQQNQTQTVKVEVAIPNQLDERAQLAILEEKIKVQSQKYHGVNLHDYAMWTFLKKKVGF
ncbi:RimK family alpha-L-glutamate ligase [Siphonobacter sp. SORGH_AS_0500]|uniref:ATP-grasp domain-containing protein n=1 Tax=Siphonobacter sp. SORGH_AS_0500 TaxID=1864824 RepID=UPI00285702FB|nr:RimK family alpha-L-glutamate ligase [Siphonobacter sp. SORGH_AS_0500]MDR6195896.1 ribosomal protein S6--L-glutamate ligase [Siphonobacter sp. SORGH_AS_0500]